MNKSNFPQHEEIGRTPYLGFPRWANVMFVVMGLATGYFLWVDPYVRPVESERLQEYHLWLAHFTSPLAPVALIVLAIWGYRRYVLNK